MARSKYGNYLGRAASIAKAELRRDLAELAEAERARRKGWAEDCLMEIWRTIGTQAYDEWIDSLEDEWMPMEVIEKKLFEVKLPREEETAEEHYLQMMDLIAYAGGR